MHTPSMTALSTVVLCLALVGCGTGSDDGADESSQGSESESESGGETGGDGPFHAPSAPFCGTFEFDGNYGPDYASALAVLDAQTAMTYPSYYLQEDMIPPPVYDYDNNVVNREFWVISILDSEGGVPLQSVSDILDNEGNHYWIDWCPD